MDKKPQSIGMANILFLTNAVILLIISRSLQELSFFLLSILIVLAINKKIKWVRAIAVILSLRSLFIPIAFLISNTIIFLGFILLCIFSFISISLMFLWYNKDAKLWFSSR